MSYTQRSVSVRKRHPGHLVLVHTRAGYISRGTDALRLLELGLADRGFWWRRSGVPEAMIPTDHFEAALELLMEHGIRTAAWEPTPSAWCHSPLPGMRAAGVVRAFTPICTPRPLIFRGLILLITGAQPRDSYERRCIALALAEEQGVLAADPPLTLFQAEVAAGIRDIGGALLPEQQP
jgi:hypothetical protein